MNIDDRSYLVLTPIWRRLAKQFDLPVNKCLWKEWLLRLMLWSIYGLWLFLTIHLLSENGYMRNAMAAAIIFCWLNTSCRHGVPRMPKDALINQSERGLLMRSTRKEFRTAVIFMLCVGIISISTMFFGMKWLVNDVFGYSIIPIAFIVWSTRRFLDDFEKCLLSENEDNH